MKSFFVLTVKVPGNNAVSLFEGDLPDTVRTTSAGVDGGGCGSRRPVWIEDVVAMVESSASFVSCTHCSSGRTKNSP